MTILIAEGTAKIVRRHGNIAVIDREGNRVEVPAPDLDVVVAVGERIAVSSSAMITLATQGIPFVVISGKTDVVATMLEPFAMGTADIRESQYLCCIDADCRLRFAKEIIKSKLKGLRNLIRYEHKYHGNEMQGYDYTMEMLLAQLAKIDGATSMEEVRVAEAVGSKYAWNIIVRLIPEKYGFTGRKPRADDVINSGLSLLYAIIYGILHKALVVAGLDPYAGFIHVRKQGRLSLVYDFSELFKPIAIHVAIQASRNANLKKFRNSKYLKPRTVEILVRHLYRKLKKESEKYCKRQSLWQLPIREARKLQKALTTRTPYTPYIYRP